MVAGQGGGLRSGLPQFESSARLRRVFVHLTNLNFPSPNMNAETILMATDLNADVPRILNAAGSLRALHPRKLLLLHVMPREIPAVPIAGAGAAILPPPLSAGSMDSTADEALQEARARLEKLAAAMGSGAAVETEIKTGHPATVICETATAAGAGLVVVASHGHGLMRRLLLGSTAQYVANNAPCDVLILRPQSGAETVPAAVALPAAEAVPGGTLHPLPAAAGCVA